MTEPTPFWDKTVVATFSDGGVVLKNPSEIAGTWAWCGVAQDGTHVREQSGYLLPEGHAFPGWARVEAPAVSNNHSEFYAVLRALEGMPDGWAGRVATDSMVTITRFRRIMEWIGIGEPPIKLVPEAWQVRAKARLTALPGIRFTQLAGHPTQIDLTRGFTWKEEVRLEAGGVETRQKVKVLVSRHQVWCDERCTYLAQHHETAFEQPSWYRQDHPDGPIRLVDTDAVAA